MAAPGQVAIYKLDPEWNEAGYCKVSESGKPGSCHGCKACHIHAANKLYRCAAAADAGRAHPYCKCKVVIAGTLPEGTWTALFGKPKSPTRASVDRRDQRTRSILKNRY